MKRFQVLYNPLANNGQGKKESEKLSEIMKDSELVFEDVTAITDFAGFFGKIGDDAVILSGGDGTIN